MFESTLGAIEFTNQLLLFSMNKKGGGKNNNKISRLKPIMRLVKRRVLWISGIGDKILDEHRKDKSFDLSKLLPNLNLIYAIDADDELTNNTCVHD